MNKNKIKNMTHIYYQKLANIATRSNTWIIGYIIIILIYNSHLQMHSQNIIFDSIALWVNLTGLMLSRKPKTP